MHNRWNLEFDIDNVPGYEILMDFDGRRIWIAAIFQTV